LVAFEPRDLLGGFRFLYLHLLAELFNVLVGSVEDLHQPLVLLELDQLNPTIEVVLSQKLLSLLVFDNPVLVLLLHAALKMILEDYRPTLGLSLPLLVELIELLRVLEDLIQELLMTGLLPRLLPVPHVVLEPVEGASVLLGGSVGFRSLVELSIKELTGVHEVAKGLQPVMLEGHLVVHVVGQDLTAELLLVAVDFEALQV